MMIAVMKTNTDLINLLCGFNARVDDKLDRFGLSAVSYAAEANNGDMIRALLTNWAAQRTANANNLAASAGSANEAVPGDAGAAARAAAYSRDLNFDLGRFALHSRVSGVCHSCRDFFR